MSKIQKQREWRFIEKINPRAAALLREADKLQPVNFDFRTMLTSEDHTTDDGKSEP